MKKLFITLLIFVSTLMVLNSCGGKMSPEVYNESIVNMHSQSWDYLNPRMEQIFDDQNTSKEQAAIIIDSLNTRYDFYIKRLSEMNYPEQAEAMHQATTKLFVFVKDSVISLYSETLKYEPKSDEWLSVWNEIDNRMNGRANQLEDQMIEEQSKFAKTVGQDLK